MYTKEQYKKLYETIKEDGYIDISGIFNPDEFYMILSALRVCSNLDTPFTEISKKELG